MPTLNQRLGSFPNESRVAIFPRYRQDCPLPPLINKGGFNGLRGEKIGSKVSQKTSHSRFQPTFSSLPFPSTMSSAPKDPANTFLLHQQTAAQPPYEPKSSPMAEQPPRPPVLSLWIYIFSFLPLPAAATVSHHRFHCLHHTVLTRPFSQVSPPPFLLLLLLLCSLRE